VLVLRDVLGLGAEETCSVLDVSDGVQRVLLHRGRSKVRAALERHLAGEQEPR
jgi:RNA polymerase sigma-70 factor, ECF subfamily